MNAIHGKVRRLASEEVTLESVKSKMPLNTHLWIGMLLPKQNWSHIIRFCGHPVPNETAQNLQ